MTDIGSTFIQNFAGIACLTNALVEIASIAESKNELDFTFEGTIKNITEEKNCDKKTAAYLWMIENYDSIHATFEVILQLAISSQKEQQNFDDMLSKHFAHCKQDASTSAAS